MWLAEHNIMCEWLLFSCSEVHIVVINFILGLEHVAFFHANNDVINHSLSYVCRSFWHHNVLNGATSSHIAQSARAWSQSFQKPYIKGMMTICQLVHAWDHASSYHSHLEMTICLSSRLLSILNPEYSVLVSVIKFSKDLMLTLISTPSMWLPKPTLWSNSLRAVADNEEYLCCMHWYLHKICEATLMGEVAGTFLWQIATLVRSKEHALSMTLLNQVYTRMKKWLYASIVCTQL